MKSVEEMREYASKMGLNTIKACYEATTMMAVPGEHISRMVIRDLCGDEGLSPTNLMIIMPVLLGEMIERFEQQERFQNNFLCNNLP